jgi:catechol 2,3-dioxygenase-like lactoylglutathione lyase family enzyme
VKVGSVVIDCNDFDPVVEFWKNALGYEAKIYEPDDWALLVPPDKNWVNVGIQKVPEPHERKNRLHLDLYAEEPEAEIERLLGLGATRFPREPEPNEDFVVLLDPDGNQFCVIDASGD